MDGILGLPVESAGGFYWSLVQSGALPKPEFSWYMEPHSTHGSELTLGGVDGGKYRNGITYVPVLDFGAWLVEVAAVYVDSKTILNKTAPGNPPLQTGVARVDTGTAFMQTPDAETAASIYAQISPEIYQIDTIGSWGAACTVIDRVKKDVTFLVGPAGGTQLNMTVPMDFFNAGPYPGKPGICQAVFNSGHGSR